MTKPPFFGDPGYKEAVASKMRDNLDKRADDVVDNKPNTDHVVRSWRPRGKKTGLSQEVIDKVCDLIAGGNTIPVAATACGYANDWPTWNNKAKAHLEEGYAPGFEKGESPYLVWLECVTEAKASFIVNQTLRITSGHKDWKSSAWILERRLPNMWMERKSVNVAVKTEREEAASLSTEELKKLVAEGEE